MLYENYISIKLGEKKIKRERAKEDGKMMKYIIFLGLEVRLFFWK